MIPLKTLKEGQVFYYNGLEFWFISLGNEQGLINVLNKVTGLIESISGESGVILPLCPKCNGLGSLDEPAWFEFNRLPNKADMTVWQQLAWFEEYFGELFPDGRLPDKKTPCLICNQAGRVNRTVAISEVVRRLGLI